MGLITSLFTLFNALLLYGSYGKLTKGNAYLAVVFFILGMLGLSSPDVLGIIKPQLGIFIFPTLLPLNFVIGPFIFFYFRFTIKNSTFKLSQDYIHLIPFVLFLINLTPFYLYSIPLKISLYELYLQDIFSPYKIKLLVMGLPSYYLVGEIHMLFYLVLCFIYLLKNKERLASTLQEAGNRTITSWLTFLYVILTLLFFMNVVIGIRSFYLGTNPESYYFYMISFILFILNVKLYQYPTILYGIKFKTDETQKKNRLINRKQKQTEFEGDFPERFTLLLKELKESKEFLDSNFTINSLANSLHTSPSKVKKYLAKELHSNFSQMKNELRIQYFLDTVELADFSKYNLSGLIKQYGFTNTSHFRTLFERYALEDFNSFMAKMKKNV